MNDRRTTWNLAEVTTQCVSFLLLLLVLQGCASVAVTTKEKPGWIMQPPTSQEFLHVIGIKTGAMTIEGGRNEAARDAVGQVVNYLSQHVESRFEMVQTEFTTTVRSELETRVRDELKGLSERVELRGGLIQDWYVEPTSQGAYNVYALLRYPRAELQREMARLVALAAERKHQVEALLQQAKEAERVGDVIGALTNYLAVLGSQAAKSDEPLRNEVLNRMNRLIQGVTLRAVSGSGQRGEVSQGAKEPLVTEAVLNREGGPVSVPRLPIRYAWKEAGRAPLCETVTNERGTAACAVTDLSGLSGVVKLRAVIEADRLVVLPRDLLSADRDKVEQMLALLKGRGADFELTAFVERKQLRVVVLVKEENFGKPMEESLVGNAIAAKLVEAGYQVVADQEIGKSNLERLKQAIQTNQFWSLGREIYRIAQVVVVGACVTRPGTGTSEVGIASSRTDGMVRVIELNDGTVLAQKSLTNIAGFGHTQEEAGRNALQRLSGPLANAIIEQLSNRDRTK